MALWQTQIRLLPRRALLADAGRSAPKTRRDPWRGADLAAGYAGRLEAAGLGLAPSWTRGVEVRGTEDGDRFDVFRGPEGITSVVARFDARRPRRAFVEAVVEIAVASGCVGFDEAGRVVEPNVEAFGLALRASPAWGFAGAAAREPEAEAAAR